MRPGNIKRVTSSETESKEEKIFHDVIKAGSVLSESWGVFLNMEVCLIIPVTHSERCEEEWEGKIYFQFMCW